MTDPKAALSGVIMAPEIVRRMGPIHAVAKEPTALGSKYEGWRHSRLHSGSSRLNFRRWCHTTDEHTNIPFNLQRFTCCEPSKVHRVALHEAIGTSDRIKQTLIMNYRGLQYFSMLSTSPGER